MATAPAARQPGAEQSAVQSATCTAQSERPSSENSRVPSSGSMIQTREAPSRLCPLAHAPLLTIGLLRVSLGVLQDQYAPDERTTAATVRSRITGSRLSDQFST